jgi:hypothetical protein
MIITFCSAAFFIQCTNHNHGMAMRMLTRESSLDLLYGRAQQAKKRRVEFSAEATVTALEKAVRGLT